MAGSGKRSNNVRLNLADNVYDRLLRLSDDLGMAPATLASYAVSEWLKTKESAFGVNDKLINGSIEQIKLVVDNLLRDPSIKEEQLTLIKD